MKPIAIVCSIFIVGMLIRSYLDSTDPSMPGGGRERQRIAIRAAESKKQWDDYFKTIKIPPPPEGPHDQTNLEKRNGTAPVAPPQLSKAEDDRQAKRFSEWVKSGAQIYGQHRVTSTLIHVRDVGRTVIGPPFRHWYIKFTVEPPVQVGEKWFLSYDLRLDNDMAPQVGIVCAFGADGSDKKNPSFSAPACAGCKPFPELEHENDGRLGSWIVPTDCPVSGISLGVMSHDTTLDLKWLSVDGRTVYGSQKPAQKAK